MSTAYSFVGVLFVACVILWFRRAPNEPVRSVYIYGPSGCVSAQLAESLRKHFKLDSVINISYAKSFESIPIYGSLLIGNEGAPKPPGVRVLPVVDAIRLAGVKP